MGKAICPVLHGFYFITSSDYYIEDSWRDSDVKTTQVSGAAIAPGVADAMFHPWQSIVPDTMRPDRLTPQPVALATRVIMASRYGSYMWTSEVHFNVKMAHKNFQNCNFYIRSP